MNDIVSLRDLSTIMVGGGQVEIFTDGNIFTAPSNTENLGSPSNAWTPFVPPPPLCGHTIISSHIFEVEYLKNVLHPLCEPSTSSFKFSKIFCALPIQPLPPGHNCWQLLYTIHQTVWYTYYIPLEIWGIWLSKEGHMIHSSGIISVSHMAAYFPAQDYS